MSMHKTKARKHLSAVLLALVIIFYVARYANTDHYIHGA